MRHLLVVLGDQLDPASAGFDFFDPATDALWMAEVDDESNHVPSSRVRTALFLAAMRHFRDAQRARGRTVHYRELGAHQAPSLQAALTEDLRLLAPERILVVQPGDHRVLAALQACCGERLQVLEDSHFLCPLADFRDWARGRKELRLEYFYRWMRRRTGLLMEGEEPAGGAWNFDGENRQAFGPTGPGMLPAPQRFPPDALTQEVIAAVERHFPRVDPARDADAPAKTAAWPRAGDLTTFDWPVTPEDAEEALQDFIEHRLVAFGPYQDALWPGEPWLYHSRLAAALNLKLIHPTRVLAAAQEAWRAGRASLASVEGFVRQILGWREYVRGVYWTQMPAYLERNALDAREPLPAAYWTGETDLACLRDALQQTLRLGYAHHIQRLMVTGLHALLVGVDPKALHEWYLAVYVDAVEWVELPNTLGMSQYADGGLLGSKPYIATGKYLQKMGPYCRGCRYDPGLSTGPNACPYTTLYWDFLDRHEGRFRDHPRMALQVRNLDRLSAAQRLAIREQATRYRESIRPIESKHS